MELNTSVQLSLEQALKALIPYLQSLPDPEGFWDFLDAPFPNSPTGSEFIFLTGHGAEQKPKEKSDFLAFIASLPDYRAIGIKYPQVRVKFELVTGILNEDQRAAAVLLHSRRSAALIKLFSSIYRGDSKNPGPLWKVFNTIEAPDNRPWKGLGFSAWNAALDYPQDGIAPSGNAYVANPAYTFTLHFQEQPNP